MIDFKTNYETAIIIEPLLENDNYEEKIAEIEALLASSGAILYKTITQKIKEITPATFVGVGKLNEIKNEIVEGNVNLVVFDGEISPSQQNNISDILEVKVISRTTLILDIFALRALSPEGKILVELAQLKYLYPRLSGKGIKLSRLGGGIGTRGPGETQLETDRRHIKTRIKFLENSIKEIEQRRTMQKDRRIKNNVKTVALVGYTNTGKSTLLNLLTSSNVLSKDELFATLDPTARQANINGYSFVMIDTVGFVENLPPDLMEAFKSTLDCAVNADLILNVCDISSNWQMQVRSTKKTLNELGANADSIIVANKCDKISDFDNLPKDFVYVSAVKKQGIENLNKTICDKLFGNTVEFSFKLPYTTKFNLTKIKNLCENVSISYFDDFTQFNARVSEKNLSNLKKYVAEISKPIDND